MTTMRSPAWPPLWRKAMRRGALAPRHFRSRGKREAEYRPPSRRRPHLERRREKIGDTAHDRQPKAEPLGLQRPFRQALELFEDRSLLGLGDADAAIPNLEEDADAASTRTDEHAARARIFDGVRQQISATGGAAAVGPCSRSRSILRRVA